MARQDRGYANLLAHLHRSSTNVPISTLQASISHYLANLAPSPTPLSATLVSSALFIPYSNKKLEALTTAYRHAVHFKYQQLKARPGGLFQKGLRGSLGDWVKAVVAGFRGGHAILRLAAAGGVLAGLEDISAEIALGDVQWRRRVQNEVVLAIAETMDLYVRSRDGDGWEKEFQPETEQGEGEGSQRHVLCAPR